MVGVVLVDDLVGPGQVQEPVVGPAAGPAAYHVLFPAVPQVLLGVPGLRPLVTIGSLLMLTTSVSLRSILEETNF